MTHEHPPHAFAPNECLRCGHPLGEHVEPLVHELREYTAHLPSCSFLPDPTVSWTKCDCGFDAVLDRYDRLSSR